MNPSPHRVRTVCPKSVLALGAVATVAGSLLAGPAPAGAESARLSPTGSVVVTLRGNGHGHGMSQYGAQGAARRGLNFVKILQFYYPGTSSASIKPSAIRVKVSGYGKTLTVAPYSKLRATGWSGVLPTAGVKRYRIAPSRKGLVLQVLHSASGSSWRTIRSGLRSGAGFLRSGSATVRVYKTNGSSTRYHGVVKLIAGTRGTYVVNRVSLDDYTAGVVAREIPVGWHPQAVNAQAVAARTYGRYAVEERRKNYDICDTTQCQVYGGAKQYSRSGHRLTAEYQPAARATSNRVLRYRGKTIFAQFSASNGGWIADGGKPYLRAKRDPYDSAAPGNPYKNYTRRVSVRSLASQYGFGRLTGLAIVKRDGTGSWGGRVESVVLTGTAGRSSKRVSISGLDLQWAMGAGTTLFTVRRG